MHINDLLKIASERKASDLHLKVGSHPVLRINGELVPLVETKRLMQEDTIAMAFSIMSNPQKQKFKDNLEIDIAYSVPGLGRFRCNVFQQRGTVGLVLRVIPVKILTVRELGLPVVLERICGEQRGLILCTGTTGSGKSTTLAAMIDFINAQRTELIITIEDPIDFLSRCRNSIGSSMVMMCSVRWALMKSIMAASVVDLPDPVVPVHRIRPRCSPQILSSTTGRPSSRTVRILTGMTRRTRPTVPRCWKTLQRNRPRPGTEYAMSISRLSLNFCFWRLLMMENAMAMVSSCMRRFVSTSGSSSPLMRSTGCEPTFRWRSDALRSDAIFRRSFMCMPARSPLR